MSLDQLAHAPGSHAKLPARINGKDNASEVRRVQRQARTILPTVERASYKEAITWQNA